MGVKALAKKVGKGAIKKKAKNFVQGKKDKKKDKRQVAKNIMQKESVYAGGGAIVPKVEPVSALVPSGGDKGGDSATIGSGGGKTSFSALSETLDNIVGLTDGISTVSSGLKQQQQDELKTLDELKKKKAKAAREAKLEKGDGQGKGIGKKIMKKAKGPLDFMMNFLVNIALGTLVLFLINNADKIKKSFEFITKNWDKMMWVFRGVFLEISSGFPLLKSSFGLIGKATTKSLKIIAAPFKAFGNLIKNGFMKVGEKIFGWASKGMGAITKGIQTAAKTLTAPIVNVASKGINAAQKGISAAKTAVTTTATKAKDFVTGKVNKVKDVVKTNAQKVTSKIANKAQKVTQPLMNQASKVSSKAQKIASKVNKPIKGGLKFIQKLMGSKTAQGLANNAKAMKPLAKASKGIKIPIIGPLLVAVTSMLAGDPLGMTLFKGLGAAAGGALGTLIPIPVLGTILGEMLGEFAGELLYTGFQGKDGWAQAGKLLKDKLMGILSGGKAVLKWIGGGFGRFIETFREENKTKLGITNWLNILDLTKTVPLLAKSFFPPGEKKESDAAEIGPTIVETDADAVSEETDYEKSDGKTIIAEEAPTPPSGGGGGGGSKTVMLAASTKDVVNSYNKSVVTGQLSKI